MALTQITTDGIKDGTITATDLATNVDLVDNQKLRIGTSNDLLIWHGVDGSENSYITQQTGKHLIIKADSALQIRADSLNLWNHAQSERYIACTNNSSVELYHDNVKTLETNNTGVTITGHTGDVTRLIVTGSEDRSAEIQLRADEADDFTDTVRIHQSTNGSLYIQNLTASNTHETLILAIPNGAVELYYDNSKKFETTSSGVTVTGTVTATSFSGETVVGDTSPQLGGNLDIQSHDITGSGNIDLEDASKIKIGSGDDLQIYHSSGENFIRGNGTVSSLFIDSCHEIKLRHLDTSGSNIENMIVCNDDSSVELYHDNIKTFETISGGAKLQGGEGLAAHLYMFADEGDDNADKWVFRADASSSQLKLRNYAGGSWEESIIANGNGAVELYHDNSKKLETTSNGVTVTGNAVASSKFRGNDNVKLSLGDAEDLQIYHGGGDSFIKDTGTGGIRIDSNQTVLRNAAGTEHIIATTENGAVELFYDNSKKLETQSGGAKVTGTLSVTGAIYTDNEFNMTAVGNKFIDTAHKNNTLHFRRINDGDGGHSTQCTVSSDGVWSADFNDTSDEKLKENITTISDGAISKVKQLRPVNFDWKETDKANNVSGFIAQEIKTVLPNLVYGTEYDPTIVDEQSQCIESTGYSVNTIGIVAHLTKALQEAITKIEVLETEVAALKAS